MRILISPMINKIAFIVQYFIALSSIVLLFWTVFYSIGKINKKQNKKIVKIDDRENIPDLILSVNISIITEVMFYCF